MPAAFFARLHPAAESSNMRGQVEGGVIMITKREAVVGFALATLIGEPARAEFIGELILEPLGDGRGMRLVQPYAYRSPSRELWSVPAGAIVDGASIPRAFWSVIGGPFEGRYRNASVIHDWFCDRRTRPWRAVHRMFYDAMIESHVEERLAKIMYAAVEWFGPRWSMAVVQNNTLGAVTAAILPLGAQSVAADRALESAVQHLTATLRTLDRQLAPESLRFAPLGPAAVGPVAATAASGKSDVEALSAMLARAPGQITRGQSTVGALTATAFLKASSEGGTELTMVEEREPTDAQVAWIKAHAADLSLESIEALGDQP